MGVWQELIGCAVCVLLLIAPRAYDVRYYRKPKQLSWQGEAYDYR